jgi:hypothetical protein
MGHFELAAAALDRLSQEEMFEIKDLFTLVMASILENELPGGNYGIEISIPKPD